MCLSPFTGRAADVFGAKTVLLLNACSATVSHLLLGASRGPSLLVVSRVISVYNSMTPGGLV